MLLYFGTRACAWYFIFSTLFVLCVAVKTIITTSGFRLWQHVITYNAHYVNTGDNFLSREFDGYYGGYTDISSGLLFLDFDVDR